MLSVGPNSTCDVCLEPFGPDHKSPCSINCGHVFCSSCLDHITRSNCPLCRTPYNHNTIVRLHVDIEGSPTATAAPTITASEAEREAQRFQGAFTQIINKGSSEADLRKLLQETRAFLQSQPRDKFTALRVTQKLTVYLCDVKTNLNDTKKKADALDKEIHNLQQDRKALREQVATLGDNNQKMAEEAKWLRNHADNAQVAYQRLVEQYNQQMIRFMDLTEKTTRLREDPNAATTYATPTQPYYSVIDPHKPDLTGVAEQVPDSYLISPLAQFTGRIAAFDGSDLPDVTEEVEEEEAVPPVVTPGPTNPNDAPNCGAAGHPLSCDCFPLSVFSPTPQEIRYTTGRERAPTRQPSFTGPPPAFSSAAGPRYSPEADQYGTIQENTPHYSTTPPDATYDVPYATPRGRDAFVIERPRSRSRSIRDRDRDRSRPVSRGISRAGSRSRNSGSPTRAPSPVRPVSYLTQSRTSSSRDVHHTPPSNVYPTPPNSGREGGDVMRSRLHDILDSPMVPPGSHFPSSYRERTPMPDDPEASRPPSRGAPRRSNSDNAARDLTRPSSSNAVPVPVPVPTPNPNGQPSGRTTTASQAAAAIEERQRQERRERRKAEKERERLERERSSGDVTRRNAANEEVHLQSRDPYGNPNSSNSSSHRGAVNYNGWSSSGAPSSSLREGSSVHAAYQPQSRKGPSPVPIPMATAQPGIYV